MNSNDDGGIGIDTILLFFNTNIVQYCEQILIKIDVMDVLKGGVG